MISWQRRAVVYFIVSAITALTIFDMVTGREDFPFSPFKMFAVAYSKTTKPMGQQLILVGYDVTGKTLPFQASFVGGFDDIILTSSMSRSLQNPGELRKKLTELLDMVKRARLTNLTVPEFVGLRLYRQRLDGKKIIPDNLMENTELVAEIGYGF